LAKFFGPLQSNPKNDNELLSRAIKDENWDCVWELLKAPEVAKASASSISVCEEDYKICVWIEN